MSFLLARLPVIESPKTVFGCRKMACNLAVERCLQRRAARQRVRKRGPGGVVEMQAGPPVFEKCVSCDQGAEIEAAAHAALPGWAPEATHAAGVKKAPPRPTGDAPMAACSTCARPLRSRGGEAPQDPCSKCRKKAARAGHGKAIAPAPAATPLPSAPGRPAAAPGAQGAIPPQDLPDAYLAACVKEAAERRDRIRREAEARVRLLDDALGALGLT